MKLHWDTNTAVIAAGMAIGILALNGKLKADAAKSGGSFRGFENLLIPSA